MASRTEKWKGRVEGAAEHCGVAGCGEPGEFRAPLVAGNARLHAANVNEIFLSVFARPPRPDEQEAACRFLEGAPDRAEAYRSLLWSLLATNEFLFNH